MNIRLGNAEKRSKGRVQALQLLFTREFDTDDNVSSPIKTADVMEGIAVEDYAYELYEGVISNIKQIDETIEAASENWTIARMPITDRSILRIAVFEILNMDDIPASVSINEAIELAKEFGGEDESYKFVNGLLGQVAQKCASDFEQPEEND